MVVRTIVVKSTSPADILFVLGIAAKDPAGQYWLQVHHVPQVPQDHRSNLFRRVLTSIRTSDGLPLFRYDTREKRHRVLAMDEPPRGLLCVKQSAKSDSDCEEDLHKLEDVAGEAVDRRDGAQDTWTRIEEGEVFPRAVIEDGVDMEDYLDLHTIPINPEMVREYLAYLHKEDEDG